MPNCKHTLSTYYEGISTPPKPGEYDIKGPENPTPNDELNTIKANIRRYKRLEEGSLHPENIAHYKQKREEWERKLEEKYPKPKPTPKPIPEPIPVEPKQQIKPEYKFTPGNTRSEIESRMEKLVGPEYINLGRMNTEIANEYLEGVERVYHEYPQLKNYSINTVNTNVKGQGELAHYGKTGTPFTGSDGKRYYKINDELSFKSPRDMAKYKMDLEHSVKTNFQYEGAGAVTTAIHEKTHWIDSLLGASKNGLLQNYKYTDVLVSEFSWNKFTVSSDIIEEAYKKVLGVTFKSLNNTDMIKELGDKAWSDYITKRSHYAMTKLKPVIGKYAFTDNQEMLAQCISYELGGHHNEFTTAVKEIFDRYVEEYL